MFHAVNNHVACVVVCVVKSVNNIARRVGYVAGNLTVTISKFVQNRRRTRTWHANAEANETQIGDAKICAKGANVAASGRPPEPIRVAVQNARRRFAPGVEQLDGFHVA